MSSEGYSVYIIRRDDAVRRALALLCVAEGFEALTCGTAAEHLGQGRRDGSGCILLDLLREGRDDMDQLDRLRREGGGLPVIVTGIDEGTGLATRALRAGATAFLDMPFGAATLLSAIAAARREPGSRSVPDAVAEAVGKIGTLSRRERQVLAALAAGWRRREIAADLGISVRTVEVHQTRMLRRLRLARAAEAVRVYLLAGLAPSSARPPARSAGSRSPGAA